MEEIIERAVRASGPGGQHINKTSTAVELRFDIAGSVSLPDEVKARLRRLAGSRLNAVDEIVVVAQEHRSQIMNRQAGRERLLELFRQGAIRPKYRRPTRPTRASKLKRLEGKTHRSGLKAARARPKHED